MRSSSGTRPSKTSNNAGATQSRHLPTFTAVYERVPKSEGGGYMGYVEEVPGAITQGETLRETRENLKEALHLILETNAELFGAAVPRRRIIREQISIQPEY